MQRETAYDPVFDAQEHYRLLLDAMARPGKINILPRLLLAIPAPATGAVPSAVTGAASQPGSRVFTDAAALVGFALLNADVSFFVDGPGADPASRYLLVNTSARPATLEEADFVFASGRASAVLVEAMKKGSLPYPEEGATLILSVGALATEPSGLGMIPDGAAAGHTGNDLALTLQGPGILDKKMLFVRGLNATLMEGLQQSNIEFPLGVDTILTDGDGRVAGIPRSSRIRWEAI
ncbi:MAG TPA: phosphonate C-P lyase system protein PhnH [Puia sp.]|nr:phosphonate C-P lyase system protein PhnH [Puia sp.]